MKIPSRLDAHDRAVLASFGTFLVLCITAIALIRSGILESPEIQVGDRVSAAREDVSLPGSIPVEIGAYIENIYLFSSDHGTFDADGRVWLIWPAAAEEILKTQQLPPERWLHFVNRIDDWDFSLDPGKDEALRLGDGRYYRVFRFSGHFYANDLDFRRYPFHTLRLPVAFELGDIAPAPGQPIFHLMADRRASGAGRYVGLVGYRTTGFNILSGVHEYATDFGLDQNGGQALRTRQVAFVTSYQGSVNAALLTLFLPLAVLMALVLFSPMLSASLWDIRLGIPPMALLTLIFLQQAYKEKLPELPYITFLDVIYNLCYFVNLILFAVFLWGSNRLHQASEEHRPEVVKYLDIVDHRFQLGLTAAILVLALANWFILAARSG